MDAGIWRRSTIRCRVWFCAGIVAGIDCAGVHVVTIPGRVASAHAITAFIVSTRVMVVTAIRELALVRICIAVTYLTWVRTLANRPWDALVIDTG